MRERTQPMMLHPSRCPAFGLYRALAAPPTGRRTPRSLLKLLPQLPPQLPPTRGKCPWQVLVWKRVRGLGQRLGWGLLIGLVCLSVSACETRVAQRMSEEATQLLRQGKPTQAAERFLAVAHLARGSALGEEALYWASQIQHHFLKNDAEAKKLHRRLLSQSPQGAYASQARADLAALYEKNPKDLHRALQLWREVLQQAKEADEINYIKHKIALINGRMNRWEEARHMYRDILRHARTPEAIAQTEYLVAYSYFLQGRVNIALTIMKKIAKEYPSLPTGAHAIYFVADTLEEQGKIRQAIQAFRQAKVHHPRKNIVEHRIQRLLLRLKRGIR